LTNINLIQKSMVLKNKIVSILLIFVLMLQSCAVYQKTAVSLDEAAASKRKVLITKTDGAKLKLKKVEQIDGKYYGIVKVDGKTEKIILIENEIRTIRILNKTATTFGNIGIIAGSAIIIFTVVAVAAIGAAFGG
jgi:PBP1b-binding outer membrane lipoprotein LpoB